MNTITAPDALKPALEAARAPALPRLTSLDAFRGLVILTMTFVNYLAGVRNIPAWAKHMPPTADGYTFVDVVFPAFLFIVGVALPLALHKRMALGEIHSPPAAAHLHPLGLAHPGRRDHGERQLLLRASHRPEQESLVPAGDAVRCGAMEYLPQGSHARQERLFLGLRISAGVVLCVLLVIFRGKNSAGEVVWLQHSWWGILGLIGWAYLVCSVAYLACRGSSVALMGVLGFLIALFIGDKHGVLDWLGPVHNFIGVGPVLGTTAADVMIGVLVGNCFVGANASLSPAARIRFCLAFGIGLYLAGMLLRPLHGINKNAATDAYTLVTGGFAASRFCSYTW